MATLFGPGVDVLQAQLQAEQQKRDDITFRQALSGQSEAFVAGALGTLNFGRAATSLFERGLNRATGESFEDPRVRRQAGLDAIRQGLATQFTDPTSDDAIDWVTRQFNAMGEPMLGMEYRQEAMEARRAIAATQVSESRAQVQLDTAADQVRQSRAVADKAVSEATPEVLSAQRKRELLSAELAEANLANARLRANLLKSQTFNEAAKAGERARKRAGEKAKNEATLRKEIRDTTKPQVEALTASETFENLYAESLKARETGGGAGASDWGMVLKYAQMLNPGSVQAGEAQAMTQALSGIFGNRIARTIMETQEGKSIVLTDPERAQVANAARALSRHLARDLEATLDFFGEQARDMAAGGMDIDPAAVLNSALTARVDRVLEASQGRIPIPEDSPGVAAAKETLSSAGSVVKGVVDAVTAKVGRRENLGLSARSITALRDKIEKATSDKQVQAALKIAHAQRRSKGLPTISDEELLGLLGAEPQSRDPRSRLRRFGLQKGSTLGAN